MLKFPKVLKKSKRRVYMDHAATTPVDPEVLQAMLPYFCEKCGNASSLHADGKEAREAIEDARRAVSSLIGAKEEEIFFTSVSVMSLIGLYNYHLLYTKWVDYYSYYIYLCEIMNNMNNKYNYIIPEIAYK